MSPRLPRVTAVEVIRALGRAGWYEARQAGSHRQLRHTERPGKVTVPVHSGRELAPKTLQSILDQAGLSVTQFLELL
jgi:predicted RNA binding protein YcfA (HicA-like mRNA interferase family)